MKTFHPELHNGVYYQRLKKLTWKPDGDIFISHESIKETSRPNHVKYICVSTVSSPIAQVVRYVLKVLFTQSPITIMEK